MQLGQVLQIQHRLALMQKALKSNVKGDLETGIVTTCGAPHSPAAWFLRFCRNRSQTPRGGVHVLEFSHQLYVSGLAQGLWMLLPHYGEQGPVMILYSNSLLI